MSSGVDREADLPGTVGADRADFHQCARTIDTNINANITRCADELGARSGAVDIYCFTYFHIEG